MGRLIKKGTTGAATLYITRNHAVKKLQVSLQDFRHATLRFLVDRIHREQQTNLADINNINSRLCILKGIYPREPKNKKKANKGSTAPATFYYTKDIRYLMHEPLLQKFRDWKVFARKMARVLGKGQYSTAKTMQENKPTYTLDHIIRERYPSFVEALRDLDDALTMVFLFSTMPIRGRVSDKLVLRCQQLAAEFQHFVIHTRCLRKTFVSIKGIYYQVEVKGQTITWVVPHSLNQNPPTDVDFKVMSTFLELYETLLGFVMFKLYSDVGLRYPPRFDAEKDGEAAGLGAMTLESTVDTAQASSGASGKTGLSEVEKKQKAASAKRIKSLTSKLAALGAQESAASADSKEEGDVADEEQQPAAAEGEEFVSTAPVDEAENIVPLPTYHSLASNITTLQSLFASLTFFLCREVPKSSMEFLIRSFGGNVGWDPVTGGGSPYTETDPRITHCVVDRPVVRDRVSGRSYVQPQWVYDCINAGKLLAVSGARHGEGYGVGDTLPPHLSPFVEVREGDYDPLAARAADDFAVNDDDAEIDLDDEDEEDLVDAGDEDVGEEEEEEEEDASATQHERELAAELKGVPYSEFEKADVKNKKKNNKKKSQASVALTAEEKQKKEEKEQAEMAKMLMSRRQRSLYEHIEKRKQRKENNVNNLKRKRQQLEGQAKKKAHTAQVSK
ncbi:mRNA-binding ribosome synthesis protein nop7 [Sorochytrium milnesiophthora]